MNRRLSSSALTGIGLLLLLVSCAPAQRDVSPAVPLGSIPITPPAKYTKGAPAYAMLFHTTYVSGPGAAAAGESSRVMVLRMISQPGPAGGAAPKAFHMLPPGLKMGEYLPLLPAPKEPAKAETKLGRMVVKTYWGGGENARLGQPRVLDTARMEESGYAALAASPTQNKTSYANRTNIGDLKPGWVEVIWPNASDSRSVPAGASLAGNHFVHGNFLPHIRFSMNPPHEFMEALTVNAGSASLTEAIPVSWNKLPTAIGYHVQAVGRAKSGKELIVWSSSEKPDIHISGKFLDTLLVRRHANSGVILQPDKTSCVIPKGIFNGADGVTITVTAWGQDFWASDPPRPVVVTPRWSPEWTVKGQFLSTGTLTLGSPASKSGPLGWF